MTEEKMTEEKVLSRRKLLCGAGASVAGLALAGTMGVFLSGCGENEPNEATAANPAAPAFPWKYEKMDIEEVKAAAYEKYMEGG